MVVAVHYSCGAWIEDITRQLKRQQMVDQVFFRRYRRKESTISSLFLKLLKKKGISIFPCPKKGRAGGVSIIPHL
jgi:hypothetical protein